MLKETAIQISYPPQYLSQKWNSDDTHESYFMFPIELYFSASHNAAKYLISLKIKSENELFKGRKYLIV